MTSPIARQKTPTPFKYHLAIFAVGWCCLKSRSLTGLGDADILEIETG